MFNLEHTFKYGKLFSISLDICSIRMYDIRGVGEETRHFSLRHSSAWKQRESHVNQAVAKNEANPSFVLAEISTDFSSP